ncbi:CopD family protein [Croceicoccus sp. YJ47]|uniref:CopD family protein n=1 Tax=Croceicoccus sp. YJ47 TaxID=2798724 RepID=UPI001921BD1C|nr:CopD family protein [Croceicoccus sp. YJ47]QQN74934.1 CopD family protein [Croceicoccus sp. YJ47]
MDDTNVILARSALYIIGLCLAGVPLYLRISGRTRVGGTARLGLGLGAVAAAAAAAWWAASSIAAMAATPLGDLDYATFSVVADATPIGPVLKARLAACLGVLLLAALYPRTLWLGLMASVISIAGAWTGHAGAAEGTAGDIQRAFDAVHLVAASVWVGALLVFLGSVARPGIGSAPRTKAVARLEAFATTGTIVVAALAITGAINGWLIARHGFALDSRWSLLLIAKLVLFGAMLGLASLNRWKLTPAYRSGEAGAERRLAVSLSFETACAFAIFILVAIIGLSDPGIVS